MILKNVEKTDKNQVKLEIVVDKGEFEAAIEKSYKKNAARFNVQGFRRGRAPRRMIERTYGEGVFYEDAVNIAYPEVYSAAVKEAGIEPVDRAEVELDSIGPDGFTFTAVVTVKPEVTLGEYKGLTVEKIATQEVKPQDIDAELAQVRERNARFVEVTDRPVAEGDQINLDYCGKVDGVAFAGGTAEKQTLVIGSHSFIPGFEEQLVGMNIGETKDIDVTFPTEYHAEELAGKAAVFTVTVNAIEVKQLPELDDDFAKDVSEFDTLEEYKADIAKHIGERYQADADRANESKLVETVVDNATVDIPVEMIEEQIDSYIEDFKYQLMYQGLNIDAYYKYTGSNEATLRGNYRERAEKAVRTRLVFEAIVKAEKIKATAKQIEAKAKAYAEGIGKSYDDFMKENGEQAKVYFENEVITENLIELLKKENTIA